MKSIARLSPTADTIISLLTTCASSSHIRQIKTQLILQNLYCNTTIAYHYITACQPLRLLDSALLLFNQLSKPHLFICNSLIRAFAISNIPHIPLCIYTRMRSNSIFPNNFTFPFLLKSLADFHDLRQGQYVHTHVIKLGHLADIYVQNSLVNVYGSCGYVNSCRQVFDEMPLRDVVSWTALITGYRGAGRYYDALIAFQQMHYAGVVANQVTVVNVLAACATVRDIDMGIWLHDLIRKSGWQLDVILGTALVDMYGKCGRIEEGLGVFQSMNEKNLFTWNVLIKSLALSESGVVAVWLFNRMEQEGIKADGITLVGVLSACSHSGLVDVGRQIFSSLLDGRYGFVPDIKHYSCMIDLLARAGHLQDAFELTVNMPFQPTKAMWGSLLAGCRDQGNLDLSICAARKLVELEPENSAYYVVLSNLYAELGRWSDVSEVRAMMKNKALEKDLGYSSIEHEPERTFTCL